MSASILFFYLSMIMRRIRSKLVLKNKKIRTSRMLYPDFGGSAMEALVSSFCILFVYNMTIITRSQCLESELNGL